MFLNCKVPRNYHIQNSWSNAPILASTLLILLLNFTWVPHADSLQQTGSLQPFFTKNMDLFTVKENSPVGDIVYTLEAQIDRVLPARILYSIEGTQLFSVDKNTGQVRVAQHIDREQTSDSVSFQVSATSVYQSMQSAAPQRSTTQLTVTVLILDENDNPPKIDRVRVGSKEYNSQSLARSNTGLIQRTPTVRLNIIESAQIGSVLVDLIEAVDVDKASSTPLRFSCIECEPEFELRATTDSLLNDRLNSSIVVANQLVHIPRNNIRLMQVIVNDGKYNSSILFEVTIDDVQNKPPQFIGSSTCNVHENVPIDRTIMTIQAIDGDAIGPEDIISTLPKGGIHGGRQILYDLLNQNNQYPGLNEDFKLHPLTGQLQVANRLDREAYLSVNGVLSLKVRARELSVDAATIVRQDEDLYDSILEKLNPYVDLSMDAVSELDVSVMLIDVNDNEPHWLNRSEIQALNMNHSPDWYNSLPNDRDTGRIYHLEMKENSPAGSPITAKNEMFVYDLDNGDNANFNLSLIDPFNLFDVEPKQVSGFGLVTLKLQNHSPARKARLLDYENPNERSFIIQLIATETSSNERFTSKAQVHISVLDVNDNVPEFKEAIYHANILEDASAGRTVLLVQATDRDEVSKQLTYSLYGRSSHLFDINPQSGLITVAECRNERDVPARLRSQQLQHHKQCIDYEAQRSHHLMVEVSDGELSSKAPLTVFIEDVSDNPPVFTLPVVDVVIEEGADKLDPPIKIEATDVDQSSVISYSIVEGNFEGLFSINNATGELQLTRPIRIAHEDLSSGEDYRQQPLNKMTLIIQANDTVFATNGTIRIDVLDANDNAPKFLRPQYNVEIHELMLPEQPVVTVRAIDSDRGNNARVSYSIKRGSYNQFEINEATGVISVSRQARDFDSSRRDNYTLEVIAFDHGLISKSSSVIVNIRVLDTIKKPLEFDPQIQRTSVLEATLNNTIIHRMSVSVGQQDLTTSSQLTFEPGPIEALDKNGHPVLASESERLETMFSISMDTGDVMVNSALDHDFASNVNMTIFVSARRLTNSMGSNMSDPLEEYIPRSVGYLIINIVDENSNAPIFAAPWSVQQPEFNFQMLEELPVGSILAQLVASDVDSKISHFKIEPPSDYFELLSPQMGTIVNKRLIDYDTLMSQTYLTPNSHRSSASFNLSSTGLNSHGSSNNILQFNVYVFDSGVPQLSAKATVSVEILPVNDWDCKFEQSIYEVRIKENTLPDTLVVQVRANDLDYGEQHNQVRYQLMGELSDAFNIDMRTGLITVSNKGTVILDRERLGRSSFMLTVIGRDEHQQQPIPIGSKSKAIQQQSVRTCSSTIKIHVEDINDNPPLFSQKLYDIVAYDTDSIDVPLIKLVVRDEDSTTNSSSSRSVNSFKIIAGNVNESFNITSSGMIYATKPLNESLSAAPSNQFQLRVQVRQQLSTAASGMLTPFTDECVVRVNFVKINRFGPEWRFESTKPVVIEENSKSGTLVTRLRCIDRDHDLRNQHPNRIGIDSESNTRDSDKKNSSPIRYWIKEKGSSVAETREFKLDPVTGSLYTKVELDREVQDFYQLIVACEDNGRPQSLENVSPLFIRVLDVDDNKPEFLVSKMQLQRSSSGAAATNSRAYPMIHFSIEEHQSSGLPVGELKAIDKDIESSFPISYCLIEGNEFQEFLLDKITGILYTNQTLDREKQASYDLLIKTINDGSTCEDHIVQPGKERTQNSSSVKAANEREQLVSNQRNKRSLLDRSVKDLSFLSVRVDVLDINDNAPVFRKSVFRAGVHHRSLMNTLVTQVVAHDPDFGLNGTLSYKISEILMYKTVPKQYESLSRKYEVSSEQSTPVKPIKLIQFPFRLDQQGNLYTQQLLTQYQLMSMFVVHIEASEQAEPWRTARTKLEVYVYEANSQLKIRVNLHPRMVEQYRNELETLLSNATKYTAIINRARSYHGAFEASDPAPGAQSYNQLKTPVPTLQLNHYADENSFSNIHLIFVDNFRIINPNLVMEKFDLTSAQLFMPQNLFQLGDSNFSKQRSQSEQQQKEFQLHEMSSLIDKIALASVESAEYHASASTIAGADWIESPSIVYVALSAALALVGFLIFLFGCCCTSRIKDHIVRVAMDKLVKQQNLRAKINEQMLAAAGQTGMNLPGEHEFNLEQGGFLSSFDATKGCVNNNNENMNILQRAIESGEYIDPNYTTLNGHINMGAHFYDASELEQQTAVETDRHYELGKQRDGSNMSLSLHDDTEPDNKRSKNNCPQQQSGARQRQQVPSSNN